ncbi:MAG: mechanosensitive ion channel domain-containing protein [Candidatus Helarchaeota archaeon]
MHQLNPFFFLPFIFNWTIFCLFMIILWTGYLLSVFIIRKYVSKIDISPEVLNGIKVGLRLTCILVVFFAFVYMSPGLFPGGIPQEISTIIAAITGTIVALSTTTVIQNFIAGIYVILSKPFKPGDLIRIGDQEGIVEEISLNHTKIQRSSGIYHYVSNRAIINSKIINYSIPDEEFIEMQRNQELTLKKIFTQKTITRYVFKLELPKENPARVKKALKKACEKFKDAFMMTPEFVTTALTHKAIISFILVDENPETILQNKPKFIEEIYLQLFSK